MLFILAMSVLDKLFLKARESGVLRPLELEAVKFQCSFYADDIILFASPDPSEARAIVCILVIFADASGLKTNIAKCCITPIYANDDGMQAIQEIIGCQVAPLPLRYLGLPLSTRSILKEHTQAIVTSVANKLPTWQGPHNFFPLMARSGRLVWVKSVLTTRWLWLQRTDEDRAWSQLPLNIHLAVKDFFDDSFILGRQEEGDVLDR
jgi:hypothetical protein